jgi:exosome complex component RRP43
MGEHFKIAQPVEYYRKFLEKDTRPDGRELGEFRQTILNIGSITTADGSALIKLGNTSVMCGIKAEIATPKPEEPSKGFIIPDVELPALCSPFFKPGPPSELAQTASLFINDVINISRCIHTEDLCIVQGSACWVLYCDLVCLDYDGNLLDACVLALVAALRNVRLPVVLVDADSQKISVDLDNRLPLTVYCQPIATTFVIFEENIVFADPTQEEENLVSGSVTVVMLDSGELCMVHKPCGSALTDTKLQDCIVHARKRTPAVCTLLDTSLLSVKR